jgi:hypothetical protein
MKIKIKLTSKEFDILNRIQSKIFGFQGKELKTAEKLISGFPALLKYGSGSYLELTSIGQLAWEQNQPKEDSKVEKPKDVVYTQCVDFWLKNFHPGWTFGGTQGKALKSLINKIRTISAGSTDATVVATFQKLCQMLPEWYKQKDLPVIDAKFNEIVTEIKQGPVKKSWNQMNSAERMFFDL